LNKDVVYFAKVRPTATIPSKREEDGCYDIYACFDQDELILPPHSIIDCPTGIASAFSSKYRFDCSRERGSTGKFGIEPRSGQIDSGYRGEWFLKLTNITNDTIVISKIKEGIEYYYGHKIIFYPYSKAICQAALEIVPDVNEQEITFDELRQIPSERGNGKLGSSGK
jgi:dUTP pyrophosphatase